ncbi:MAG: 3-deoxy-manno-octulosonate cytidylyltransferase (CMP-KDO synthetase) [Halanaerobium sp. 4-GBenrich]|jgi:3-deoxy-manno-octulosonate cytidylyltransferase (CMP-KDO synthetase)|uniref:3-deoxy-manno-octulosonate cytidylyltransferase n=1 Tax=Halanaerobium congolense TaxID=54121 RepID=A0A1G8JNP0_9FIRM|nr:3-deoxy-manno-octulosonate cytidylyltransferase [Halanaerobium congolense]KXS49205.1 MAG: 3-deoxy-manno-octulosonate cytidylyltransferase (CMP-KDO synthetase) [Halanaerobium sp. T82-1]ODS50390.1 MAG: 3-deoxy-manno-octulosonate cytidylyltransferase (CMP-KDO synthetase) [Halanaerobium sp. 4-GBenrich]PUU92799.1 MAG: 3-deoxy-manno-octulosonate cytidylyltransferase (CMP-KDO synthetase) [Halanaerobium sp.]TDS31549.1 3-deoxy-manno-octulosonate cytidylyltransferase (CMP-KDO synthetase) [Halanaerobiu
MGRLKTAAVIPARYDSTRFPGKALAEIRGQAMIVRVYQAVEKCESIDKVYVATDDRRIKKAVEAAAGKVIMTSDQHQSGTDRIAEAAAQIEAELIVNVQGDEPLIDAQSIERALKPFSSEKNLQMSTLKRKITAAEAKSPDRVKVVSDQNDYALYFSRSPIPYYRDTGAEAQQYYQHIGLYVYRRDFLLKYAEMDQTALEKAESLEQLRALQNGYQIKVLETEAKLIGVDRREDIELVEKELKRINKRVE